MPLLPIAVAVLSSLAPSPPPPPGDPGPAPRRLPDDRAEVEPTFLGLWEGELGGGRLALEIVAAEDGSPEVVLYDLERGALARRADDCLAKPDSLTVSFPSTPTDLRVEREVDGTLTAGWLQGDRTVPWKLERRERIPAVSRRKSFVPPPGMHPHAPMETAQLAFLVGEFVGTRADVDRFDDYRVERRGEWILGGRGLQVRSRAVRRGQVIEDGVDTFVYSLDEGHWNHVHVDGLEGAMRQSSWRLHDGAVTSWSEDDANRTRRSALVQRFDEVRANGYTWSADVSFDDGESWVRDWMVIQFERVEPGTGELPLFD